MTDECTEAGFYNVPAECEHLECCECPLTDAKRKERDCPYLDEEIL